jgi:hypothetical protein
MPYAGSLSQLWLVQEVHHGGGDNAVAFRICFGSFCLSCGLQRIADMRETIFENAPYVYTRESSEGSVGCGTLVALSETALMLDGARIFGCFCCESTMA